MGNAWVRQIHSSLRSGPSMGSLSQPRLPASAASTSFQMPLIPYFQMMYTVSLIDHIWFTISLYTMDPEFHLCILSWWFHQSMADTTIFFSKKNLLYYCNACVVRCWISIASNNALDLALFSKIVCSKTFKIIQLYFCLWKKILSEDDGRLVINYALSLWINMLR